MNEEFRSMWLIKAEILVESKPKGKHTACGLIRDFLEQSTCPEEFVSWARDDPDPRVFLFPVGWIFADRQGYETYVAFMECAGWRVYALTNDLTNWGYNLFSGGAR